MNLLWRFIEFSLSRNLKCTAGQWRTRAELNDDVYDFIRAPIHGDAIQQYESVMTKLKQVDSSGVNQAEINCEIVEELVSPVTYDVFSPMPFILQDTIHSATNCPTETIQPRS